MIDREFIIGVKRGGACLPAYEIQQMAGRCGRSYTASGKVSVVVPSEDAVYAERCLFGDPEPIVSSLDAESAAFGVLPRILKKGSFGESDYDAWYRRSLACAQGRAVAWSEVASLLKEYGAVAETDDGGVAATPFGVLSCRFYYPPRRVCFLREKLSQAEDLRRPEVAAWVFSYNGIYLPEECGDLVGEYRSACPYSSFAGEGSEGACYYALFTGRRPKPLTYALGALRRDFGRLCACAIEVARLVGRGDTEVIQTWREAVARGLSRDMAAIAVAFPTASKPLLMEMEAVGIRRREDAAGCRYTLTPALTAFLKEQRL